MAMTKTAVLTTDDQVSHALLVNSSVGKVTVCNRAFAAWVEQKAKKGPWHGVEEPLPTLQAGRVDCMTCIVKTGAS